LNVKKTWPAMALLAFSLWITPLLSLHAETSCRVPDRLPNPQTVRVDWTNKEARTDAYLLVLSWSPEYCTHQRGSKRSALQCRDNRFDFVVHGLWPQAGQAKNKFGHPRFCTETGALHQDTLKRHACAMPSVDLMQEQWSKHGACAFATPEAYFAKIEQLWQALRKPDLRKLQAARGGILTAGDVAKEFAWANRDKGLGMEAIAIRVGKGNYLREVLICYNKSFSFKRCEAGGTPHSQKMRVRF
jgi:ribonuclease T2